MTAHDLKPDPQAFDGQRAIDTGGTQGIGQTVVARFR
jgi:hypothetical protein